jgi:hypothetical protein
MYGSVNTIQGAKHLAILSPGVYNACVKYQATSNVRSLLELSLTELGVLEIPEPYNLGYLALSGPENRPWFDLVWIIQEVAKSSDVMVFCGDWAVP